MAAVTKPGWSKPSTLLFTSEIPANEKAFAFALAQASEFGADLILFHAYDTLVVAASETSGIRYYDYAAAARVIGLSRGQVLRLEILPNLVPLVVTLLSVEMGIAILVEVILSFVGISVTGDTPTWGGMIAEGRTIVYQAPWIMALPIGCIIVSVIGFNLLGDGLRLALDPVQRR